MTAERFPLSWPTGWARTPATRRRAAAFSKRRAAVGSSYTYKERLDVGDGLERLTGELRRLGAQQVVISSNLAIRNDGLPYANQRKMLEDPGVAVYFKLKGQPRVLACDKWTSVADNMAAIAGHIEAIRAVDRYGVGTLEQAFAGYAALPAQASPWWTVLEFEQRPTSVDAVERRYNDLAKLHHPDRGGSTETMAKINAARDAARIDLGIEVVHV